MILKREYKTIYVGSKPTNVKLASSVSIARKPCIVRLFFFVSLIIRRRKLHNRNRINAILYFYTKKREPKYMQLSLNLRFSIFNRGKIISRMLNPVEPSWI